MELISYALDFTSFLLQNLKNKEEVKAVVLFGSAAREEATKESDVDIFIDVYNSSGKNEKDIKKIIDSFFDSSKFKYWKLLNIKNDINVIVGRLDEWKLKDSMLGSSIILYKKYSPELNEGKNMSILSWKNVKPNSKRVFLNKKIFGYNYYGKRYDGLIQKFNGRKLGSNVIIIPAEEINSFLKIFRDFKVAVAIHRIFEYG
ncbi:nucleotidyltransferase domain-containing protein [Candidatus Pacearchaeota archaeon]|nr:nucleotidyltransferase domain-containing protein [Candidatus Pacearchaeota archaeon]